MLRDTLNRFMETDPRNTPFIERWQALAELGALGIGFSEEQGGLGGGLREMELVLETAGQNRRSEPFIDALAIPGAALATFNPERVLLLGEGRVVIVAAFPEDHDPTGLTPDMKYQDGALTGYKTLVPSGADADQFLISAMEGDTLVLAEVSADNAEVQPMMNDQSGIRIRCEKSPAKILAQGDIAADAIRAGRRHGLHATCAMAVGIARGLFDETLAYVRVREQFGQPIGRFQVIQHRMADMMIALEEARALTDMARFCLESDGPDLDLIMARTGVLDRCVEVSRGAIQLHGGIGMSEEMSLGHGFRSLKVLQGRFGGEILNRAALRSVPGNH